ncbi:MAG: cell division protein FtsL [Bdellovibrionales bacterium]|nr:cell division protein FtsL [Bdellovibrionales bacterium]
MRNPLGSFLSVVTVVGVMLTVVIAKMEVRRLGYSVYRLSQNERLLQDQSRKKTMKFAQLTRPERIENYAQARLELKRAHQGQVIQLVSGRLAFKH